MKFNVKICPVCGQVWERDGDHNNSPLVYHGTDWPMKSYLDKGVCFGCSSHFVSTKSVREGISSP